MKNIDSVVRFISCIAYHDGKGVAGVSLSELRTKDVVNTRDGKRLGKVMDIEFDETDGRVDAIVVPGEFKVGSMLRGEKCGIVIPWQRICKIGENVILVELELGDVIDD
ncbi:MAG: YlmC/YmxH family sporulation protein [Clostridia bacterium]|nr:YlmC/YmxH family sporulation protein [Clostridia bacterium]